MSNFRSQNASGFIISKTSAPSNLMFLNIYSKEFGLVNCKVKFSPKLTNKFQGKLELLSKCEYQLYENNQQYRIQTISNVQNQHLDQISFAEQELISTICRTYRKILPSNQPISAIYQILDEIHKCLCQQGDPEKILLSFLSQSLKILGVMPHLQTCPQCHQTLGPLSYYNPREQEIFCENCQTAGPGKIAISGKTRKLIYYASKETLSNFQKIHSDQSTNQEAIELLETILTNYHSH